MTQPLRFLFPALLGGSLVLHAWALHAGWLPASRPDVDFEEGPTTVLIVEEQAPPEPVLEPVAEPPPPDLAPEPPEEPPPAPEETVLSTPVSDAPPVPVATPPSVPKSETPKPIKPAPRPEAKPSVPAAPTGAVTLAKPDYAKNPPPKYPEFARRNGWEGRVMVVASVDSSGRVRSVSLARGSGYAVLDQAALQSVRTWKFKPKKIGGQPTDSSVEVPVNFSLRR